MYIMKGSTQSDLCRMLQKLHNLKENVLKLYYTDEFITKTDI